MAISKRFGSVAAVLAVVALFWFGGGRARDAAIDRAGVAAPRAAAATKRIASADAEQAMYRIEARARAQRALTPADVREAEAAFVSTAAPSSQMQASARTRDFARRMARLARQVAVAPRVAELEQLRATVARASDPAARARLVAQYREGADELPAVEREAALAALEGTATPND